MGLYLPSYEATKLAFIRAVLQDKKRLLKTSELNKINIPRYEELSVKNLYQDAMKDPDVSQYLPDLEQNSKKYPEREFFFNVLGSVKPDYLKLIVKESEQKRFTGSDDKNKNETIMMTDHWLHELNKYPYISSKLQLLTLIEKPGKAIYLIKERSKLVRSKKSSTKHEISLRLGGARVEDEEMKDNSSNITKRLKTTESSGSGAQTQARKSSAFMPNINI